MKTTIAAIVALLITQTSCATPATIGMPCADPNVQSQRSLELQKIRDADQADRAWQLNLGNGPGPDQKTLEKMSQKDLGRRKRIGEIFGEGCLNSAEDYEAAFIVYQHGNTPGQFFQAFLWSKEALKLGNSHAKGDVAMAIDRYLVSIDHKELFGTQASQSSLEGCWCIQPIENSFPAALREEYRGGTNTAYTGLALLKILNKGNSCPATFCDASLLPSPQGTVPGFW